MAFWLPVPGSVTLLSVSAPTAFYEQSHAGRADDPEHDHDHRVGGHQAPEPVEQSGHSPRPVYATICSRACTIGRITDDRYQRLPFDLREYRDREQRVRAEMQHRGIDVLYVMSPANLNYLTGFESIWYPPRAPLGAIVRAARSRHRVRRLRAAPKPRPERSALGRDRVRGLRIGPGNGVLGVRRPWVDAGQRRHRMAHGGARRGRWCRRSRQAWPSAAPRSSTATGWSTGCAWSSPPPRWRVCGGPRRSPTEPSSSSPRSSAPA